MTRDNLNLSDGYKSSNIDPSDFATAASCKQIRHPADMTEREWDVVVKNNILTNGHVVDPSGITYIARHAGAEHSRASWLLADPS